MVNFDIVYKIKIWPFDNDSSFTLKNSLFGPVKLTINADPDKHSYSGYGISVDVQNGGFSKNVIIFGADMSSSVHVDNQKKIS